MPRTQASADPLIDAVAFARDEFESHGQRQRWKILDHAVDVASVEGLEGITIGRLATDLELSKSGLYGLFGSKEELQLAVVQRAGARFVDAVVRPVLDRPRGLIRLRAMIESWFVYAASGIFPGGCFFVSAAHEMDGRPGPVRDRVAKSLRWWIRGLEADAGSAVAQGELAGDPKQIAFCLQAYAQEANLGNQLYGEKQWLKRAREAALDLLKDKPVVSSAVRRGRALSRNA